jgi:hypothetical protein
MRKGAVTHPVLLHQDLLQPEKSCGSRGRPHAVSCGAPGHAGHRAKKIGVLSTPSLIH